MHQAPIDGLEAFRDMVDLQHPLPLSLLEQEALTGRVVDLGSACYAGMLLLQAMGLGGWMFDGINWLAVLGQVATKRFQGWVSVMIMTHAG